MESVKAFGQPVDTDGRPVIGLRLRCPTCDRKLRDTRMHLAQRLAIRRTCSMGHAWRMTVEPTDVRPDRALHRIDWIPLAA